MPLIRLLRLSMFRFQPIPPPTNTPFFPIHVNPNVALTGEVRSVVVGGMLPSSATNGDAVGEAIVIVSLRYFSPCSSAVKRRLLRVGSPTPKPQRSPLARSMLSGSPRKMNPP